MCFINIFHIKKDFWNYPFHKNLVWKLYLKNDFTEIGKKKLHLEIKVKREPFMKSFPKSPPVFPVPLYMKSVI